MKQYKYLLVAATVAIVSIAPGCSKFLESEPYSFTSAENFYKTAGEAEMALIGCYNGLNGSNDLFGQFLLYVLNGSTDECIARSGVTNQVSQFGLGGVSSSEPQLANTWAALYRGINRTNHLIANIDGIDMSESRKTEIKAEAMFLRGVFHSYLAMMFGAVPLKLSPDPEDGPRQPVQKVYAAIIADLEFAYQNLPNRAKISGAANKWSAAGFLAKAYAYMGSAKTHNMGQDLNFELNSFAWVNADEVYGKVKTITQDIITNSGYKLTSRYDYLFRETTREAQSEECLLMVEASSSVSNGVWNRYGNAWLPFGPPALGGNNSRWFGPLAEIFEKYNARDIRRTHNMTRQFTASSAVEEIGGYRYYVPLAATTPDQGNFTPGKFRQRDAAQKPIPQWASDGNFPLLRFADILLLNAEALFYTGAEPAARAVLSTLRQRAIANPADLNTLTTAYYKANFAQELLDERSRELCFETHRRFDLARFNVYTSVISNLTPDRGLYKTSVPTLKENWKPYRIWFPLPVAELDLNKQLRQNPGY